MANKILIVGESSRNRMILKKALSPVYLVIEADNAKTALDVLSSQCVMPQLLICVPLKMIALSSWKL